MSHEPLSTATPSELFTANPLSRRLLERLVEGSALLAGAPQTARLLDRALEGGFFPILYEFMRASDRRAPVTKPHSLLHRNALPIDKEALRSTRFTTEWRIHLARLALYRAELDRVLRTIERHSLAVVLKGEPLSWALYDQGRLRNTTDMDILVDPNMIREIARDLAALDYHAVETLPKTWAYNQWMFVHRRFGTIIELHWRVAFPHLQSPAIGDLLATSQLVEVPGFGQPVRMLRPEMLFLQLSYHYLQHRGFFKGLLDIAGWIERYEAFADLDEIDRYAERLGIRGVIQWPLHTLYALIGSRSEQMDDLASYFARGWAHKSASDIYEQYILMADRDGDAHEQDGRGNAGIQAKLKATLTNAMCMMVADGAGNKLRAVAGPLVFGPHRLGRAVFSGMSALGLTDRDLLFEQRLAAGSS